MSLNEQSIDQPDKSSRTIFIVIVVVSALMIAIFIAFLMYTKKQPTGPDAQPTLQGALRPGSPEFEKYRELIKMDDPEADEAARPVGDIMMTLFTTVRNFSGRTINGLEMKGTVVDLEGKPIKERTMIIIPNPNYTTELDNNKTLFVRIPLEGFTKNDVRANIKIEITGIKFK